MFCEILKNNNLTIKDISEGAMIPRSTLADLVNGKTSIEKMSAGNLYKLGRYLKVNMQDLFIYCNLPEVNEVKSFIQQEDDKIVDNGLKLYVKEMAENNLVETTYALNDMVRFQKYMSAIRDFYKYGRLQMPKRFAEYVNHLED